MTTEQRQTIVQRVGRILDERIGIARWFRQNACMKHGLPFEDQSSPLEVTINQQAAAAQQPPTTPAATEPASESKAGTLDWLKKTPPWLLAAAAGLGGVGLHSYFSQPSTTVVNPPAIQQPSDDPQSGSLLQYLEDELMHLPPEGT